MRLALPNDVGLPQTTRFAFADLIAQLMAAWHVSHTPQDGALRTLLTAYQPSAQTLTTGTWTALLFDAERDYRGIASVQAPIGVHSKTLRTDRFLVPASRAGLVRLFGRVVFDTNATGSRGIFLTLNGVQTILLAFLPAATAVGATTIPFSVEIVVAAQDELGLQAYQNSGGNLTVSTTSSTAQNEVTLEFL